MVSQIVDGDSGNLYQIYIYIYKVVVLASEPVCGRSRATKLPCCTYVSSVMRSSPGPPKIKIKVNNKFSSDYFHILHVVERIAL